MAFQFIWISFCSKADKCLNVCVSVYIEDPQPLGVFYFNPKLIKRTFALSNTITFPRSFFGAPPIGLCPGVLRTLVYKRMNKNIVMVIKKKMNLLVRNISLITEAALRH